MLPSLDEFRSRFFSFFFGKCPLLGPPVLYLFFLNKALIGFGLRFHPLTGLRGDTDGHSQAAFRLFRPLVVSRRY